MKKSLSIYGIAYLVLITYVFWLLYVYPKLELHLLLNSWHTDMQDIFFKYYSTLAEWPLYVLALVPILLKRKEITIFFFVCELLAGTLLQILKHLICTERPICAFEHCKNMVLPLVQGVNMHHSNSFPSGHASTFFVFYTCCALLLACHYQKAEKHNHRTWLIINLTMLLLLALATLGAYSRIYLSQHFLSDVCMGSIIGFLTPCLVFYFFSNKFLKHKLN